MEYLLGVDGAFVPDPSNPLRAAGPFGDKSVIEWPEYEPPAWLDSIADAGPVERLELRCRRLVARVHVLLYATPEPPGDGRATARRPRRARVRRVRGPYAFPRRDELGGADPAAPCGADPAGRPQRDLLGVGALRRGAHARAAAAAHEARAARQADRDGREPRGARDAARARSPPAVASTGCCCSRAASSASGPTSRSRASLATSASPGSWAACCAAPASRSRSRSPAAPPRRTARTTAASPAPSSRRATRPGSPRCATPTRGRAGATRFDPHLPALIEAVS